MTCSAIRRFSYGAIGLLQKIVCPVWQKGQMYTYDWPICIFKTDTTARQMQIVMFHILFFGIYTCPREPEGPHGFS